MAQKPALQLGKAVLEINGNKETMYIETHIKA